jgi:hypothetical protein
MLKVKRWVPSTFTNGDGDEITFEVKRLKFEDATPISIGLAKAYTILETLDIEKSTAEEQTQALGRIKESVAPGLIAQCFREYVRNVGGIEDEDGPIATGEALYEVADERLVMFVLARLRVNARLGNEQGKGSSSSRTPTSPETTASSSPATSTESEGGQPPSTATEIPPEPALSTSGA